jgi:hypothetical protein
MITVLHAQAKDREVRWALNQGASIASIQELIWTAQLRYTAVARVDTSSPQEAFQLTNSIDTDWWKNSKVHRFFAAADGCRSTSVGDIIVLHEDDVNLNFFVAPIGFTMMEGFDFLMHVSVFDALDNAKDNSGINPTDYENPAAMAEDLISHSPDHETDLVEHLVPHIKAWIYKERQ